jgi:hypothetical protein
MQTLHFRSRFHESGQDRARSLLSRYGAFSKKRGKKSVDDLAGRERSFPEIPRYLETRNCLTIVARLRRACLSARRLCSIAGISRSSRGLRLFRTLFGSQTRPDRPSKLPSSKNDPNPSRI